MALPSEPKQPGAWDRDGRVVCRGGGRKGAPPVEPATGGGGIDPSRALEASPRSHRMVATVQQHVRNGVPDFPRRSQDVDVAAVREHGAAPSEDAIRRACKACGYRLHSARERMSARGFDDQVDVVALDRVVRDAETTPLAGFTPAPLDLAHEARGAQRRNIAANLQRDVARVARGQARPAAMEIARSRASFAARVLARSSPTTLRSKVEAELPRSCQHATKVDTRV